MDFDSSGKLPAGIHDCSAEKFEELFVEQFPTSQSRRPIFCSLIAFIQELFQTLIRKPLTLCSESVTGAGD